MGNASSFAIAQQCLGPEVAAPVVKSLAGATQQVIEGVAAKIKGIGASPGLDSSQVAHVLGDGRGCHADLVVAQMETKGVGRIDFYEVGDVLDCCAVRDYVEVAMLAVMTMCGKIPARSKVRNLFDLFDEDLDGKLNSAETVMLLRSFLWAVAKSTGGVLPTTADVEAIWDHIVQSGFTDDDERLPYAQWVSFCAKTKEVHALGKALDFNKGVCRKSLISGTRAILPVLVMGEEFPEVEPQRVVVARKPQERTTTSREQAKSAAAREGKSKFSRSSILKIKELFDSIDKDGSGYVEEREWRRLTRDTALAASDDTVLLLERQREGEISIVEVLCEVHPRACDGDLAKMLEWISEPTRQGPGKTASRELAMAERIEFAALFQIYDTEGNGEITLGELSRAMAEITGLTKEDITPMFLRAGRTEEDFITESEFADTVMEFVEGDPSIQSLMGTSAS